MRQQGARVKSGSRFPETSWGLVLAVRDSAQARRAFDVLCGRYWMPVYASLRRQGFAPPDAEDLTQGFFLHLIERDTVTRADPERGRFRSFLLGALRWFLANQGERERARKRGGECKFVSIDTTEAEASLAGEGSKQASLELQFDQQWARSLVHHALTALQSEYTERAQEATFHALRACLDAGTVPPSYAELASQLASSEGAVKVAVHRLRQRFRELLRSEVELTVAAAADVDDELRHLRDVFAAGLAPA